MNSTQRKWTERLDAVTVREMTLYGTNSGDIYRRRVVPICRTLARRVAAGTYDPEKAARAFRHVIPDILAGYRREFCGPDLPLFTITAKERDAVAAELRDHYQEYIEELARGESS